MAGKDQAHWKDWIKTYLEADLSLPEFGNEMNRVLRIIARNYYSRLRAQHPNDPQLIDCMQEIMTNVLDAIVGSEKLQTNRLREDGAVGAYVYRIILNEVKKQCSTPEWRQIRRLVAKMPSLELCGSRDRRYIPKAWLVDPAYVVPSPLGPIELDEMLARVQPAFEVVDDEISFKLVEVAVNHVFEEVHLPIPDGRLATAVLSLMRPKPEFAYSSADEEDTAEVDHGDNRCQTDCIAETQSKPLMSRFYRDAMGAMTRDQVLALVFVGRGHTLKTTRRVIEEVTGKKHSLETIRQRFHQACDLVKVLPQELQQPPLMTSKYQIRDTYAAHQRHQELISTTFWDCLDERMEFLGLSKRIIETDLV